MFGALMGTLTSFQKQTSSKDSKLAKRAEIDARIKERVAKEKEEMEAVKEQTERERKEQEEEQKSKLETETVINTYSILFGLTWVLEAVAEFVDVRKSSSSSYTMFTYNIL
jgi:Skp family chaperone for outer membrane proteins